MKTLRTATRHLILPVLLVIWLFPGIGQAQSSIAVAAGIAPCVREIMEVYRSQGGQDIPMVTGPCGALAKQAEAGAPYDLILLSEPQWPRWLEEKGLMVEPTTFATGQLVLWSPGTDRPDLSSLEEHVVALPDPETTAYGALTRDYLKSIGRWDAFMAGRTVPAKSAPQAVVAVTSGSAQWAFVPESAAIKAGGDYLVLEGATIPQVGGLAPSAGPEAREFWKFCLSEATDPLWVKWGLSLEGRR